jgi:phospholipid/cholesterol/gamma-HCH transport system ATP-binding protein
MTAGEGPLLRVEGLVSRVGGQLVHDGLELTVQEGEVLGVVGGTGSGKTVLLRTITGLRRPEAGRILFAGRDLLELSRAERHRLQRYWGMVFQHGALFSGLTVAENVALPMREHLHLPKDLCRELAELRVRMVGLDPEACHKFPAQLSGGMIRRAALARALALEPALLFLDEPTVGLDPVAASGFDELILYLRRTLGLTVVIVTHDLYTLVHLCDRMGVLVEKRLLTGTLAEMRRDDHPWSRAYFHGPRMQALLGPE